ncbi:NAD(P)-dependent alcohol dehydrogenase [Spirosoma utsteinense]|uniref:Zinc-type alcohol dehydrogenase-like protein n=1 Tax=Spirosoma utsteinense TaxID=2585773 RepID=A0ABR6W906_9BACT|nr:NAD(P)-dependent alcohol dehydrogenase [Spirosoma utsteinense]MBC3787396.1 putative zinc-type alcohol dehydrogenase-like protein [Spirosoma utsteinense]MBC3793049.1 putative zinc-type alcohol dehydrogenase-like protein [Spirosoma utsteinense]
MEQVKTKAYGTDGALLNRFNTLSRMDIERNTPKADEVLIDILYCGVCHSDLHQVRNDWGNTIYPCVPGHEIVGKVVETGTTVTKFKVGDVVGVGCMVDSCGSCPSCREGEENYCQGPVSWTATYNGYMKPDGSKYNTFGGYSTSIVVKESFVLRIPESLDIKAAAPILCAGVTTYSPLRHWNIQAGSTVGVVGIGGLGHMGVKIARAMGATVTAITTKKEKRDAALALGAHQVIVSTDAKAMKQHERTFDFILSTVPDEYDINPYVSLLKRDGAIVTVGLLAPYKGPLNNMEVAFQRRTVSGSLIGSIQETQEVLDFCAEHGIQPDVELIAMQNVNDAYDRLEKEDVRFRFVIDMESLKNETE